MVRRKIGILCLQETKWVEEKAKEVEPYGHKLWYIGKDETKNRLGIVVAKELREDVNDIRRKGDRIRVYAPQIDLDATSKQ